jgi:hypothetical protein
LLNARSEKTLQELQGACCIKFATRPLVTMQEVRHAEGQEVLESTSQLSKVVMVGWGVDALCDQLS